MKRTPLKRTKPLRARKPMKRGKGLQRGGPIQTKPETRAKTFARGFHSELFVEFVHSLGCAAPGCRRTDVVCAHTIKRSQGGKWYDVAPLCGGEWPGHHQEQEGRTDEFNARYGIDLYAIAHATAQRFMERHGLRAA